MHRHGGDIYRNQNKIDYSANINFLGMPQAVRQAAKDAIDDAVHYPDPFCEALKQAIAEKEGVPAEWIFCGNGAADVIFTLMLAEKPKEALLPIPSFYEYRKCCVSDSDTFVAAGTSVLCTTGYFRSIEETTGFADLVQSE